MTKVFSVFQMDNDKETKDGALSAQQEPVAATESGIAQKLNMSIDVIVSLKKWTNKLTFISQMKDFLSIHSQWFSKCINLISMENSPTKHLN